jgi:hypothetical protein
MTDSESMCIKVMNPYQSAESTLGEIAKPTTALHAALIAATCLVGLLSWAAMFYALRDAVIRLDSPGHAVVIHQRDLKISFGVGIMAAIVCTFGVIRTICDRPRRWTILAVYAVLMVMTCFPAIIIAPLFIFVGAER